MNVTIIGAGVSGLCLAIKLEKMGIGYTIYEKEDYVGGLWNLKSGIVNKYSNVQVVSPSFRFQDDESKYGEYTNAIELQGKIEENFKKFNINDKIKFKTIMKNFKSLESNKVQVTLIDLKDNTEQVITTDALYIRTGTLNKVRELNLPNESSFNGIINYGTNEGKEEIDFKDKIVTVIGMGATAVENMINALQKGAKKVIVLARSFRNVWTRKMLYQVVKELIYPQHYLANYFRVMSWKRVNEIYNKTYQHIKCINLQRPRTAS